MATAPQTQDRDVLEAAKAKLPVSTLLRSAGCKIGRGGRATCPFCQKRGKMDLSYKDSNGLWRCFSCEAAGDIVTLISKIEGLRAGEAIKRVLELAGMDRADLRPDRAQLAKARDARARASRHAEAQEHAQRRRWAKETWGGGQPLPQDKQGFLSSVPLRYLANRGLNPERLWDLEDQGILNLRGVLRFTPASMLAALQSGPGAASLRAVHRTRLDPATHEKLACARAKQVYGFASGGGIYLSARASRAGDFAIAEGIESALAVTLGTAMTGQIWPCAAAYALYNLGRIAVPADAKQIYLIPDNDGASEQNRARVRRSAAQSARALQRQYPDAVVSLVTLPQGCDPADLITDGSQSHA